MRRQLLTAVMALVVLGGGTLRELPAATPELLLVVGAEGEAQYGERFRAWTESWLTAAAQAQVPVTTIGLTVNSPSASPIASASTALAQPASTPADSATDSVQAPVSEQAPVNEPGAASAGAESNQAEVNAIPEADPSGAIVGELSGQDSDRARLAAFLQQQGSPSNAAAQPTAGTPLPDASRPLWIILIGHGTYDGRTARFNLRGADFSAEELAKWLEPITRPLVIIDTTACSGPFLPLLSRANRVVITATQNGDEQQFTRLAGMLSEAVVDPAADLDKDEQTSLLEAVVFSSRRVAKYYAEESRLATEHALIDDNGDRLGTPLAWFEGVMANAQATTDHELDGTLAHQWHFKATATEQRLTAEQLARRADLERQLNELRRRRKDVVDEDAYYQRLEPILLDLARLYRDAAAQP